MHHFTRVCACVQERRAGKIALDDAPFAQRVQQQENPADRFDGSKKSDAPLSLAGLFALDTTAYLFGSHDASEMAHHVSVKVRYL